MLNNQGWERKLGTVLAAVPPSLPPHLPFLLFKSSVVTELNQDMRPMVQLDFCLRAFERTPLKST